MDLRRPHDQALRAAIDLAGSEENLARRLGVCREDVYAWLEGRAAPPLEVFLDTLDMVADGPYRRRRRIRVAVLKAR